MFASGQDMKFFLPSLSNFPIPKIDDFLQITHPSVEIVNLQIFYPKFW